MLFKYGFFFVTNFDGFIYIINMKDSFGRDWSCCESEIDKYCRLHNITLVIEYKQKKVDKCLITYFYCKTYFTDTYRTIFELENRYPLSDEEILLRLKETLRNKKIDNILWKKRKS